MYDDVDLAVQHNGKFSAPFQTNTGVKQECPLSPLLFNLVIDEIMSEVCSSNRGITWSLTRHLEDLQRTSKLGPKQLDFPLMQQKSKRCGSSTPTKAGSPYAGKVSNMSTASYT
ncbi:uncharacterized protein LOC123257650 [Drosophila ananassae]|uniref:uncharacterized protein LOC123257650 n=1 Tax=Drosophila ananassae TaxID=7217 RepID=UPI001CFF7D6D|nr:uncharacterized protein LOC123257650 [Drosophila ananassae]